MREVADTIRRGVFEYAWYFPRGTRRRLFDPTAPVQRFATFQDWILHWHRLRSPFLPGGMLAKDPDLHPSTGLHDEHTIRKHLLPAFGAFALHRSSNGVPAVS